MKDKYYGLYNGAYVIHRSKGEESVNHVTVREFKFNINFVNIVDIVKTNKYYLLNGYFHWMLLQHIMFSFVAVNESLEYRLFVP